MRVASLCSPVIGVRLLMLAACAAAGLLVAPAAQGEDAGAPYVDSKAIKERFGTITPADMEMLRGKKILFASRSFGLNLFNGMRALKQQNPMYAFDTSYQRYDVFKAGGDLSVIPADAFAKSNIVHFLATYWPHTKRAEEVDDLMRKAPHEFGKQVDAVIIYYHTAMPGNFEHYCRMLDALQKDFPNARIIYTTAGFMADSRKKENENAHAFSELVRKRYQDKAPLYDLGKILSDDFRSGHAYCPEYSKDPAGVHPNLDAGQTMMAKGLLLVLRDTFRQSPTGKAAPGGSTQASPAQASNTPAETIAETHPDYRAVRAILDANDLKEKTVESVSVVKDGRIVELYLQEGGITKLTDDIGRLSRLRVLHVYGDRNLSHPLLKEISPAIGSCAMLEDLLLNHNELTELPIRIARLRRIKSLSVADNHLKDLPPIVTEWIEKHDAEGLKQQGK